MEQILGNGAKCVGNLFEKYCEVCNELMTRKVFGEAKRLNWRFCSRKCRTK